MADLEVDMTPFGEVTRLFTTFSFMGGCARCKRLNIWQSMSTTPRHRFDSASRGGWEQLSIRIENDYGRGGPASASGACEATGSRGTGRSCRGGQPGHPSPGTQARNSPTGRLHSRPANVAAKNEKQPPGIHKSRRAFFELPRCSG